MVLSRRIGCLVLVVVVFALGACSSSPKPSSSSSSTTRATAPVTGNPATSTTGAGGAVGSTTTTSIGLAPSTTVGTPNCAFSQLDVSATGNSGAGHIGVVLRFKNTSTETCTLVGYPGVAALNAAGKQVVQAKRTLSEYLGGIPTGQRPPVVTLTPGASASALVEGTDVPTGNAHACPTYPKLLVTPPNTRQSVTILMSMPGCSPIEVHPVVSGASGSMIP